MDIAVKQFPVPRPRASGPGENGKIMTKTEMSGMIVHVLVEEDAQHGQLGHQRSLEAKDRTQRVRGQVEVPVHPMQVVLMRQLVLALPHPLQHRLSPMAEGCADE